MVEQGRRVSGVVRHRVRTVWDRRLAEAALVVGDDVEVLANRAITGALAERRARAVEEQQRRPVPAALVVDVDPVHVGARHGPDHTSARG